MLFFAGDGMMVRLLMARRRAKCDDLRLFGVGYDSFCLIGLLGMHVDVTGVESGDARREAEGGNKYSAFGAHYDCICTVEPLYF